MCKLNNATKKDSSINKLDNISTDNIFNYKTFHNYRTLEQRKKEKELNKNNISSNLKKKNLSIEYNFNSNIFLNRINNIFPKQFANLLTTINNTDNNDNDIKLLSDKYNTHQGNRYKKIINN